MIRRGILAGIAAVAIVAPAPAATPREMLTTAAFQITDKKAALALVNQAIGGAEGTLATHPNDREALLQRALGTGYRAKLTRSPSDAKTARRLIEGLVDGAPRDAEFQMAIGGWHLDAIADGFFTATVLGARRDAGLLGLDQAVALGGNRAFFRGFAAMMRIRLDPKDVAAARGLAEAASAAPTPTPLDHIAKRDADAMLIPLRAGDGKAAATLARKLLPFGRLSG